MSLRPIARVAVLAVLAVFVSASSAAADAGIKFGPTFANFSSDALDFDTRTGIHGGVFFGGNRSGVFGLQGELNWIRKRAATETPSERAIRIDYLQIPVLLRLNIGTNSPSGFAVYGIAGPAFDLKIADEIEGVTIDDGWEGADVDMVFGGGIEAARIIVEGRWEKGFRRINKDFLSVTEIKKQAFTILFGVRFD
jgi:Outer membrane protein beta-barrel domain